MVSKCRKLLIVTASGCMALVIGVSVPTSLGAQANRQVALRTDALGQTRVTIGVENALLSDVLREVARQAGLKLFYRPDLLPAGARVSVHARSVSASAAFRTALQKTGLQAVISPSGQVALARVSETEMAPVKEVAAMVTGKITDAQTGQLVRGATVALDGTARVVRASDDGAYRMTEVSSGRHTLTARALGFAPNSQSVDIPSGGSITVNFALSAVATSLDQVVITGTVAGEQRRSIGNAVSTINATEVIAKSGAQSVSSLIGARAPGVTIAQTTGRIGAGPSIQIRGRSSIGLDNSPLLYIDGVRVNNATSAGPSSLGPGGQNASVSSRLNDISPEDIESIEIIKGPAAATIYGTEAANGVIQIITKKGAAGKTRFTLQVQDGAIWFRDAAGRMATNYVQDNTGNVVAWNSVKSEAARGTPIFKTGQTRVYNGALSGGRNALSYYVSGVYENDVGIEPNNSLRQYSSHANVNVATNPRIDFGTSLNFVDLSSHLGADAGFSTMFDAEYGHGTLFPATRGFFAYPPEVPQTLYDNAQGITRFTGSETINYKTTSWLSQRLIAGLDYTGDDSRGIQHFAPPALAAFVGPVEAGGSILQTLRHNTIISADYSGTAKFNLTSVLTSASSIGGQLYRTELNTSTLGGTGFPGPGVETVSAASTPVAATQTETVNTTIGAYGQEQFGWHDRLFLTGAVRVDNNSAFGSNFKWITYPKVSAAWVLSEEPFWHVGFVNSLKLRAAYGESGRQPAAFSALQSFSPTQGPGGTNGVTATRNGIGNADLKPERGKETELGFEGQMFSRLDLDFTYFSKRTTDEIIAQSVPPSSGFPGTRFANLGRVDNHGVEVQATVQALTRENLGWTITGNLATSKDVIKSLGGLPSLIVNAGQFNVVGGPIGGIYTRRVVSADRDPTTGFATNVLCDGGVGGSPVACAAAPFVFIGTPTPKTTGSVANTFTIAKRLRLYALVDFKLGQRQYDQNEANRCLAAVGVSECRSTYYPLEYSTVYLAEQSDNAFAQGILDRYYHDGSFAKLREVSATYTLPASFLRGFSRASITLAGRELHTWTKFPGIDPEASYYNAATSPNLGNQAVTPPLSRFIATINLTF